MNYEGTVRLTVYPINHSPVSSLERGDRLDEEAIAASTVVPSSCCFLSSTSRAISWRRLMDSGTTFSPCEKNKCVICKANINIHYGKQVCYHSEKAVHLFTQDINYCRWERYLNQRKTANNKPI